MVSGVFVPPFVTQERLDKLKDFSLRPDDIWVVAYPKAGTTWTQQIVRLARNGGVDDGLKISTSVPWLEGLDYYPEVDIERLPTPRAFKSHFSYNSMPCGLPNKMPGKYIYVTRNPKDVAVSMYYQDKSFVNSDSNLMWDDFLEDFLAGRVEFGGYFDHVLSWWLHKDDENVLFLKYEDMKKDLLSEVTKIVQFIGFDLDKEIVREIASKSTFENMKGDPLVNYSWSKLRRQDGQPFMRKGEVGDWRNLFSEEQSKRVDAIYLNRFKPVGLELDFVL